MLFPERYIFSVQYGLNLFAISVLPALFPFFFFSKILAALDIGALLGRGMEKPLRKLYNVPSLAGYIFVLSLLCGYPVGAKLVADAYDCGMVDTDDAKKISSFCSTSGPLFILGTIGVSMLQNKAAAFIILISHYISAVLSGLIFCRKKASSNGAQVLPQKRVIALDALLADGMTDSILSIAIVGGYISIFSMVADVLSDIGLVAFLSSPLTLLGVPSAVGNGIITALIEFTRGCLMLSESGFSMRLIAPLCTFAITFGGMSVTLQSLTFLSKCKISPGYYLKTKLVQAVIALAISAGLSALFL